MKKKTIIGLVLTWVVLAIFLITRIMDDGKNQKIKEFTAFFDVPGNTINEDNEIKELIAQKNWCILSGAVAFWEVR